METIQNLDVRIITPKLKHLTIFKTFDRLENNQSFVIINDHNPKPLYNQMQGIYPGIFLWEYLKEGPLEWRVKITKNNPQEKTIGQLAAEDYKKALVFKKLGIDFCCGGKKTLKEVAKEKGLDLKMIEDEFLSIPDNKTNIDKDFLNWKSDSLINHIVDFHHEYVKKTLPEIIQILYKVVTVHSAAHPELEELCKNFISMANELSDHMAKEESIIFPYINRLEKSKTNASQKSILNEAITLMEHEHVTAASYFDKIRQLTNEYETPPQTCNSFRILYASLNEFEQDLKQHVHLENNILFPKAISLEKEILNPN